MTLTEAAGCITKQESLLRDTLAACTYFQSLVSESTAAAAKAHIYLESVPPPHAYTDAYTVAQIRARRPFAYIWTGESQAFTLHRIAAPNCITPSGTLLIRIERDVPNSIRHDYAEVDRTFKNIIGQILQSGDTDNPGLAELNGTAGYRDWERLDFSGPVRTSDDDLPTLGDAQMCEIMVQYGTTR